jgi:prolyl-tRNA synthetase
MFSDADLIGVPLRLVVSPKTLERNAVEFSHRDKSFSLDVKKEDVVSAVKVKIDELVKELTPND